MIAAVVLVLTPGPSMALVASYTLTKGRAAGLAVAAGVCTGTLCHTALASLGLSAALASSDVAFTAIKFAGAAYLVWIAVKLWRADDAPPAPGLVESSGAWAPGLVAPGLLAPDWARRAFRDGLATNILNPKVALFFLALLPQFVDPARGGIAEQIAVLGIALNLVATGFYVGFTGLTARLGASLRASAVVARWLRRTSALFFGAVALRLALAERP